MVNGTSPVSVSGVSPSYLYVSEMRRALGNISMISERFMPGKILDNSWNISVMLSKSILDITVKVSQVMKFWFALDKSHVVKFLSDFGWEKNLVVLFDSMLGGYRESLFFIGGVTESGAKAKKDESDALLREGNTSVKYSVVFPPDSARATKRPLRNGSPLATRRTTREIARSFLRKGLRVSTSHFLCVCLII